VSDAFGYNSLGEATSYQATASGTPVFEAMRTRCAQAHCLKTGRSAA
jgi:hypothetical protein